MRKEWAAGFLTIAGIGMAMSAQAATPTEKIQPLVGKYRRYTARPGDTPAKIARREHLNADILARINGLSGNRISPGRKLLLPTLHVLPRNPHDGIVLNLPERMVYVFKNGALLAHYPVAIGKPNWQTDTGEYKLVRKDVNPTWKPTKQMQQRENLKDDPVPPGKENPLGDRWMGWSKPGLGFHSTNVPNSIGKAVSHGCVRLYPEQARRMFDQVTIGMPIYSVYEPVRIGERGGKFFLSVFPDLYHKNLTTVGRVEAQLKKDGLLPLINAKTLTALVRRADGYPHRIVGSDTLLKVNDQLVILPIAPTQAYQQWIVPAKAVANALNAQMEDTGNDARTITANGHTLTLTPGQKTAKLDERTIHLRVPPTVVNDTFLMPLRPLAELCGARVAANHNRLLLRTMPTQAAKSANSTLSTNPPNNPAGIFRSQTESKPKPTISRKGIPGGSR